jgi:hypothetical protein
MTVLAYVAILWFAAGPWIALGTGLHRHCTGAGWLFGCVPFAGPFLALWLIPSRPAPRPASGSSFRHWDPQPGQAPADRTP